MHVFITGGSGFVGGKLREAFLKRGDQVTVSGTRTKPGFTTHGNLFYISADTSRPGSWQDAVNEADVIVNLTGRSIFRYWTKAYKQKIFESRVHTTKNIVDAIPGDRKPLLLSASAAGFYGDQGDTVLAENAPNGNDFLAQVCRDWENEAFRAREKNARVVIMRFGVVLGKNGGAMKQMIPAFRAFLGGPIGNGRQWFPWIHIDDLVSASLFLMENTKLSGAFNFTAPELVQNRDFVKALGRALHRPSILPAPSFFLRLILGEFGSVLLASQRAVPERLLKSGFRFTYSSIDDALKQIVA